MDLQSSIDKITAQARKRFGKGHVADYIPALAKVPAEQFGIALCDLQGNIYSAGDAHTGFSIQSISKLFNLVLAIQVYGDDVWQRVGREPSGQRFNSMMQLETENGIPRNPFINAGALRICDLLESRCSAPNYRLVSLLRELVGTAKINVDKVVAYSELEHGSRNAAMAYLMKSFDNFDNQVDTVLASYTHHCAIEMNCVDLAKASLFLANRGRALDGQQVLTEKQNKRVNALLATCGLYDAAGDFAYRVGLPAKSGVGGGIVAVYPGHYSICVWSPALNSTGNSLLGTYALQAISEAMDASIY